MRQQNGGGWQAVKEDGKQRFGLLEEGGQLLIRANQGHNGNTLKMNSMFMIWVSTFGMDIV